jgi:hypothetical protein
MRTHHAIALGSFLFATNASAQSSWRLSADRLFGFGFGDHTISDTVTRGGTTITTETRFDLATVNLFGAGFQGRDALDLGVQTGQLPRFGLDYELASHITIGAAAFLHWSTLSFGSSKNSSVGFGVAPRVGYAWQLSERWTFWPRAGVSIWYAGVSTFDERGVETLTRGYTALSLNVEPTLVFMLTTGFGVTAAAVLDLPLLGNASTTRRVVAGATTIETTTDANAKQLFFGLQFGVTGRF